MTSDSSIHEGRAIVCRKAGRGVVRQCRVNLGDVEVISNSLRAVRRIVDAHQNRTPSLANAGDFRYVRAKYPYRDEEDAFVFIGDNFVSHAVGPLPGSRATLAHGGPYGAAYTLNEDGLVSHPLNGTAARPNRPQIPVPDSELTEGISALSRLGGRLSFEGEGDHRGLQAVISLRRTH